MKKNEKRMATDQEMRERAEELEAASRQEQEEDCRKGWRDRMGVGVMSNQDGAYAEEGVFKSVITYLASRCQDLQSDYCSPRLFLAEKNLIRVLAHDFTYEYTGYLWNETSHDPSDSDAFDESSEEGCLEPEASNKELVVKALKDFLTLGAAKAKLVGSDAYLLWREALLECVFVHYSFGHGAETEKVEAFWKKVQQAARTTWADVQIDRQMKLLKLPKKGAKGIGGGRGSR